MTAASLEMMRKPWDVAAVFVCSNCCNKYGSMNST
jgi:hypothetical protein